MTYGVLLATQASVTISHPYGIEPGKADRRHGLSYTQPGLATSTPQSCLTPDTSSPSPMSISNTLPSSPSLSHQSSINNLVQTTRNSETRERSKERPSAAAIAQAQAEHPELNGPSSHRPTDQVKPAMRRARNVVLEQAGSEAETGTSVVSQVKLEGSAGLCQYAREDYKHMCHMQWADRRMETSPDQSESSS